MDNHSNVVPNGEAAKPSVAGKITPPSTIEKSKIVRYVVPANEIQTSIRGHEIIEAVHRSIGSFQNIVADVKDILRGVEADVRAVETIQLTEEPNKRTLTIQRKYRITKDR